MNMPTSWSEAVEVAWYVFGGGFVAGYLVAKIRQIFNTFIKGGS
jgi:hypothetical protein